MKHLSKHPAVPVALRHEDKMSSGIPDISVTVARRTVWVEAKIRRKGSYDGTEIQRFTLRQLESKGLALYIVYDEDLDQTELAVPSCQELPGKVFSGYQPKLVAAEIVRHAWRSNQKGTSTEDSTQLTVLQQPSTPSPVNKG